MHPSFALYHAVPSFPRWCSGKESACYCRRCKRRGFNPWVGKIPWRRKWQTIPVFLPGKYLVRGLWEAVAHSVSKESNMTEHALVLAALQVFCFLLTICWASADSPTSWPLSKDRGFLLPLPLVLQSYFCHHCHHILLWLFMFLFPSLDYESLEGRDQISR